MTTFYQYITLFEHDKTLSRVNQYTQFKIIATLEYMVGTLPTFEVTKRSNTVHGSFTPLLDALDTTSLVTTNVLCS